MATINYPTHLPLAQVSTPLQYLKHCSEQTSGPRIWVKRDDLTGSVLSGNKVRKLSFSLAEALAQGCDTVITCGGVQSNHCRATAIACAQLGLNCHLILRGEEAKTAGVNKYNIVAVVKSSLGTLGQHPHKGLAGIDRVEHQAI